MSWRSRLGLAMAPQSSPDQALCRRIAAGEPQALAELYRRESGAIYRFALGLSGDEAQALDAMQEAFVELVRKPGSFDPERGSLGAYLAGIARHQILAAWRERERFEPLPDPLPEDWEPQASAGSDAPLHQRQADEQLWRAIRRLPWAQREALVLVKLQERPYAEAAAIAGVSLEVLRSRLHRARERLEQLLQGEQP